MFHRETQIDIKYYGLYDSILTQKQPTVRDAKIVAAYSSEGRTD